MTDLNAWQETSTQPPGYLMAREIADQPEAVRATVEQLLPRRGQLAGLLAGCRAITFNARGSSDNAAAYGRYLLEGFAGIPSGLMAPSIATHYRAALDLTGTAVVSISQSGQTQEIVATQRWAAACGAVTVAITNHADSVLAQEADLELITRAGDERAVPATKTFTCQLAAVALLVTSVLSREQQAVWDTDLARVPQEMERLLAGAQAVEPLVASWKSRPDIVVTGRGVCLGVTLEMALKVEETCLRAVRAYSYADLRHGPIAAVDESETLLLVSACDGPMAEPMTDLASQMKGRGALVVGIGGNDDFAMQVDHHIPGPDLPEPIAPLGLIVPAQLACLQLAQESGLNPDSPEGLRKVTRTDRPR